MATLVTGASGFVAANVVKALAERGHKVVALDINAADDLMKRFVEPWADQVTIVQDSITDVAALERLFASSNIDKVVHAAAVTPGGVGGLEKSHSKQVLEINLMGTVNVLDLARANNVKRFLYVGSGSVYGGVPGETKPSPHNEDAVVNPANLYRITKVTSERIVERYREIHDMDTVGVRLAALWGPMERPTGYRPNMSMLFQWTGKAMRGEPIEVRAMPPGDYTYVKDVANGIATVLDAPSLPHRLYNLGRGASTPTSQLVAAFSEAYPDTKFVTPIPEDPEATDRMGMMGMDFSRVKEDLGFEAVMDPGVALKDYFHWRIENNFTD